MKLMKYRLEFVIAASVLLCLSVAAVAPADSCLKTLYYLAWKPKNCQDAIGRGYGTVADRNQDCTIDFTDFATIASQWKLCNDPCDANCAPYPW